MPKLSKKRQEEIARAEHEARVRAALRWTEEASGPDVEVPTYGGLATGYLFNAYLSRVNEACTSSGLHSAYRNGRTTTQGARRLFSTRLRALLALRNAVERECAERLAGIDRMIEGE